MAYVHVPEQLRKKLDERSMKGKFIGYVSGKKAYKIWDLEARNVHESADVVFDEGVFES